MLLSLRNLAWVKSLSKMYSELVLLLTICERQCKLLNLIIQFNLNHKLHVKSKNRDATAYRNFKCLKMSLNRL